MMIRNIALAIALALALALAPAAALAQAGLPAAALLVPSGQVLPGDVATTDRPIVVQGLVEGDVTSWSGPIQIDGAVRGDVVSYVGTITLGPAAEVGGSVLALGGAVERAAGASVAGQQLNVEQVPGRQVLSSVVAIFGGADNGAPADLPLGLVAVALGLAAMLLTAACALVWPRRTTGVALALRAAPARSLAVGLLTTILLALLAIPASALLALSLVGLPLLLPLLLILQAPYLFGLAGLGRVVATRIAAGVPAAAATAVGAAVILLPLVLVGALAPAWSAGLFYLIAGVGLGGAILSRGGAYPVMSSE
jgi:hypothetical protein